MNILTVQDFNQSGQRFIRPSLHVVVLVLTAHKYPSRGGSQPWPHSARSVCSPRDVRPQGSCTPGTALHNAPSAAKIPKCWLRATSQGNGILNWGFFWYFLNNLTIRPVWDASFILFLYRGSNNNPITWAYLFLMFYCLPWLTMSGRTLEADYLSLLPSC